MQQNYSGVVRLMRSCPQPIIGLVHGAACGAGFSFLLACDVRFAAPDARMNAAYIRIGVGGCDMGSGYLAAPARTAFPSHRSCCSRGASSRRSVQAIGLISDIVPADDLLATRGSNSPPTCAHVSDGAAARSKQALNVLIDAPSLDAALMMEDRQQVMLLETHDHSEAVAAFRERRDPSYCGSIARRSSSHTTCIGKRRGDLLQLELTDLAAGGARQVGDHLDTFRPELLGHLAVAQIGLHRRQIDGTAGARDDERAASFAEPGVRETNHCDPGHRGMFVEQVLDFDDWDVFPAPDQDVASPGRRCGCSRPRPCTRDHRCRTSRRGRRSACRAA